MGELHKFPQSSRECRFCRFFDTVTNIEMHQQVSVCRHKSPASIAQLVPTQGPGGQPMMQWTQFTLWPVVGHTDWCGDFSKKPSEVERG